MDKVIGFIGYGNMAQAMIGSIIKSNLIPSNQIIASRKKLMDNNYNIKVTRDNKEVAMKSDYIIIAVKPHIYEEVLHEIKNEIKQGAVVIGIAAGISSEFLRKNLNKGTKYLKVMPNTPAMVGEGITAIVKNDNFTDTEMKEVLSLFQSFGKTEFISENLMDGFTALCGSSPAYVYMMIEAMADGAVLQGIPRSQAYPMAAQAVLGAAKMVLETGLHPGTLKDNVCSPGGTTIEAVASLEENGFRSTLIEAMRICADKSRAMGK